MKKSLAAVFLTLFATGLWAEGAPQARPASLSHATFLPAKGVDPATEPLLPKAPCGVIAHPKAVAIFWGPTFSNPASPDYTYAQSVIAYRNQLGASHVWTVLSQYGIPAANLGTGTADWFDTSTPPTNVTDSAVQSKVSAYLATHGSADPSTVYEVFLPSTSFSSSGSSTSCGGPSLAYCAYTSLFTSGGSAVHYSVQPYASCTGCKVSGWTAAQNQEHFVEHETVDFVTDPSGSGCLNVADKCAWSPTPFLLNGFGYQYLWSNANSACVR